MSIWLRYLYERFDLLTLLALIGGISLSGIFLNNDAFNTLAWIISFIGIFLFFILMGLINDVKDYEKDRIANSERPLPRGFVKKSAVEQMISLLQIVMFAYGMMVWVLLQPVAGLIYICLAAYLWMMQKDFFLGHWLRRHPFLHGILLQLFILPLALFSVSVVRPDVVALINSWAFAFMLFGAFFCNAICRKLDPHAHPIIVSYLNFYGFHRTFEIATVALVISCISATALNLVLILLPCELFVLLGLSLLFFQPKWFKIPETLANISLMLHAWAIVLFNFH